jgi:hypothetical protein
MPRIVAEAGPDAGKSWDPDADVITIGRAPGNVIQLADHEVSRRHVSVRREADVWVVVDEGSTNGTLCNGLPVRRQPLRPGDRVQIGDTRLRIELAARPAIETTVTADDLPNPTVQARVALGSDVAALTTDLDAARRGLRLLRDMGGAAAQAATAQDLARAVVQHLLQLRRATRAVFLVAGDDGPEVLAAASGPGRPDGGRVPRAVLDLARDEGAALLCADPRQDPRLVESVSIQSLDVSSLACVPLLADRQVRGYLYLEARGGRLTEEDLRLLATVGDQVALALANLRMREALAAQERIERELEHARRIQQAFLPERLPELAGVRAAARSIPAREVGGDFYGVWPAPDGGAVAVLGDVSGKGVGAALVMARTLAEIRAVVAAGLGPSAAFSMVNAAIGRDLPMGLFVTAALAWCDPERGRLTLCNAGHPLPLLRHADGAIDALDLARGVPLGIDPAYRYQEATVAVAPGDCLLLVSDGVGAEAGAPDPEWTLAEAPADPEGVVEAVLRAPDDAQVRDDRTALAVRFQ